MESFHSEHILQTCTRRILALELKQVRMEQCLNQQNILLDTLGAIMEELKRLEP